MSETSLNTMSLSPVCHGVTEQWFGSWVSHATPPHGPCEHAQQLTACSCSPGGAHCRQVLMPELLLALQRQGGPRGHRGVIVELRSSPTCSGCSHSCDSMSEGLYMNCSGCYDSFGTDGLLLITSHPGQLSGRNWANGLTCPNRVLIRSHFTFSVPESNWIEVSPAINLVQ